LLSETNKNEIIRAIKPAPFHSIILDRTQDISKVDQLCEIYRYCSIENGECGKLKALCINKSLLSFSKVEDHSAAALSEYILHNIENNDLSATKYRGQGYDGASSTSRI
jgi:hypothetical protein